MGTYLGLPEGLEGAKTKVFAFVKEKIEARINSWSAKFLSKGGKEVLIKSVLTAIPSYVMSCYRLPKTLTLKISAAIAKFWWHNSGSNRGIHWVKWEHLCKSKNEGGLGFRAIEEFNSALLAKQLWRLITYPHSLLARILQGRYFSGSTPLVPRTIYSPSYGWRSIISARDLLLKGLISRIGNGNTIKVWSDPWIPDTLPRPPSSAAQYLYPDLKVSDLIDPHSRLWKEALVKQFFTSHDANIILGLHIPRAPTPDRIGWHFTKSGVYTVRSGYWAERNIAQYPTTTWGPNTLQLQNQVWKMDAPQKLKHFMWQALSGQLPVKSNLVKRGIDCDTCCDRCGSSVETINHALFECPPALQAWALSKIPLSSQSMSSSIFSNFDYLFWRLPNGVDSKSFPWILWHNWKARNGKVFNNEDKDPRFVVMEAEADAEIWTSVNKDSLVQRTNYDSITNIRDSMISRPICANPMFTGYRCMVDASWKDSDLFTGLGWYCYLYENGEASMGAQSIRRSLSPLHAEFEALLWAMTILQGLRHLEVEFLVDCSDLVKMIDDPAAWPAFHPYLEDFSRLRSGFRRCSLVWFPRLLNYKADFLARSVRGLSRNQAYVNNVPSSWTLSYS